MSGDGFFSVFGQAAFGVILIISVVCCRVSGVQAGDETIVVVDQQLAAALSECLNRGNGWKLRGYLEALAGQSESELEKLRAMHDECPNGSAQRLSLAMACLVCGDVSHKLLGELAIDVCSGEADRTEATAVALRAWSQPLVNYIRRHVLDGAVDAGSRLRGACLLSQWEDVKADPDSLWRRPGTAVFVVEQLSYESGLQLAAYSELLRPQAAYWVPEACRRILTADPGADRNLAALLSVHAELAIPRLRRVLERRAPYWPDELELPAGRTTDADVQQQVEAGSGRIGDRWAFCLDIRFSRLLPLLDSLSVCGYRPIRVRPLSGESEQDPRMSVVWVRDGRRWELLRGQRDEELPARRQTAVRNGLVPADLCLVSGTGPCSGWLSVWEEPEAEGEQRRLVYGVTAEVLGELEEQYAFAESEKDVDFSNVRSLFSYSSQSGERVFCAVFSSLGPVTTALPAVASDALTEQESSLLDITWSPAAATTQADLRRILELEVAETAPWPGEESPDQDLRWLRTRALFGAGQPEQILAEFSNLTHDEYIVDLLNEDLVRLRCLAFGQLGKIEEASLMQRKFAIFQPSTSQQDRLGISLSACWRDFETVQKLILEARTRCEVGEDYYALACGTALAARFLQQRDAVRESSQLRKTAIELLQQAVTGENAVRDLHRLVNESDLMDLHPSAGFQQIRQQVSGQSRFAAVSAVEETGTESMLLIRPSATELLEDLGEYTQTGWRPAGILASREGEPGFSLLLQRLTADELQLRTEQSLQGAAAHVLLRLGQTDVVLQALEDMSDPAIRFFLLRRFQRYAVNVGVLLRILAEGRTAGIRQAIVQGLGELASGNLIPHADQNAVRTTLLKVYAEDSDPGVHSAAGWSLTRLGADEDVAESRRRFRTGERLGQRWWYETRGAEVAMAILAEPIESAQTGRLAVSICEITGRQYMLSRGENPRNTGLVMALSPQPAAVTWHQAAAFCNWLSQQEGIPEQQWCYVREQTSPSCMRQKQNARSLEGYRLPTSAEWTEICEADAVNSYLRGADSGLLQDYAWFAPNSADRSDTESVGLLRPNRNGLFDTWGNAEEWCHDGGSQTRQSGADRNRANDTLRFACGGNYMSTSEDLIYGELMEYEANERRPGVGFRVVRMIRERPDGGKETR